MKTIQEKMERMDLTMARRPKGNYEAYYCSPMSHQSFMINNLLYGGIHCFFLDLPKASSDTSSL